MSVDTNFATTLSDLGDVLRVVYGPGYVDQIYRDHPLWSILPKGSNLTQDSREAIRIGMHARARSQATTNLVLPEAHTDTFQDIKWVPSVYFSAFDVTYMTYLFGRRDMGQIVDQLQQDTSSARESLVDKLGIHIHGDGLGVYAAITEVTNAGSKNVAPGITIVVDDTKHLRVGQHIDFIAVGSTTPDGATETKCTILTITPTTNTITVLMADADTTALTATDRIVDTGSYNTAIPGLGSLLSATGTFMNVSPSSQPLWAPAWSCDVTATYSGQISERLIIEMLGRIADNRGRATVGITTREVRMYLMDIFEKHRRVTTPDAAKIGAFYGQPITFDNRTIPVLVDPSAPDGTLRFLTLEDLSVEQATNGVELLDIDGQIIRQVEGKVAWYGEWAYAGTLRCQHRNWHGQFTGITGVTPLKSA